MKLENTYQIVWITTRRKEQEILQQSNVCYELELKFSNSCAIFLQDGVFLLLNRTLFSSDAEQLRIDMTEIFKNYTCKIGVSARFSNLRKMPDYYQQALYAATAVQEQHDSTTVGFYRDHALHYLSDHGKSCFTQLL